ncbi:hypothetical protein F5H01DRAFT_344202 [Linnemannia elongata]|uniref:BAG domain-containing protein n=1 Tax=Linnemannia elongata AG-77 TaxID=1314771 RepID=A0A197JQK3_9FUNG|nr:hypothetical protein F5H01DRAFT_344202 [Linnemannia elongata]OAQ27243.1 hypothetical protein K457DRAFT_139794 [Linnemannia elongata AG-77]
MTQINIKWGREKKSFTFNDRSLPDIRLGELRKSCHDWSKVPLGGLTLIYGGATMKDDNAPLSCFGIKPNGQITMMGTRPTKADISTLTTHGDPEEYALIVKIQQSLQSTLDLVAEHFPRYESAVQSYISSASSSPQQQPHGRQEPPPTRKQLQDAHMLLSETLMKSLLVFDGVVCKQDFEVARATRREAVKETQKFLDSVDDMNARVKECDRQLKLQQQQQQQR